MNFGAVDGASLRSGYALPACRPVSGGFINRRTVHLSKPKRRLDKPGHLSGQLFLHVGPDKVITFIPSGVPYGIRTRVTNVKG